MAVMYQHVQGKARVAKRGQHGSSALLERRHYESDGGRQNKRYQTMDELRGALEQHM